MMKLSVTQNLAEELRVLSAIESGIYRQLISALENQCEVGTSIGSIKKVIKSQLPESEAQALESQLLAISSFLRDNDIGPEDFFTSVLQGVETQRGWNREQVSELSEKIPFFCELLRSKVVVIASKAMHLSFDYSRLLHKVSVVTDIRPVFDDDRETIRSAVVANTLRIDYYEGIESKTQSLALDLSDIRSLRDACDLAIKKSAAAKDFCSNKNQQVNAIVVGDSNEA